MNATALTERLYPLALALTNVGVGLGLYMTGALFFAALLWLGGGLVLAAMTSTVDHASSQSGLATE
jgi:hypothetical protein